MTPLYSRGYGCSKHIVFTMMFRDLTCSSEPVLFDEISKISNFLSFLLRRFVVSFVKNLDLFP